MEKFEDDGEGFTKDVALHVVLGAVVFTLATCFVAWPEIQAVLA